MPTLMHQYQYKMIEADDGRVDYVCKLLVMEWRCTYDSEEEMYWAIEWDEVLQIPLF